MASPTAIFTGVGVALVTLFDGEGEIDAPATADHAARLVEAGVQAIVVAGTTGEAATLDDDERSDLLIAVRYAVDGRVPVLAGTGAPSSPTGGAALEASRGRWRRRAPRALPGRASPTPVRTTSGSRRPSTSPCSPTTTRRRRRPACRSTCSGSSPCPGSRTAPATPSGSSSRPTRSRPGSTRATRRSSTWPGAIGCSGAILALANVDPEGCLRAWAGDGTVQRELINGHRAQSLTGIPGLKRTLCALHGTRPVTRVG